MRLMTQPRSMFAAMLGIGIALWLGCNRLALADEGEVEPTTTTTTTTTTETPEAPETQKAESAHTQSQEAESQKTEPVNSLDLGESVPPIEPTTSDPLPGTPDPKQGESEKLPGVGVEVPAPTVDIDAAVIGVTPEHTPPFLLREGEFIINRRGELKRLGGSGVVLLVFEQRPGSDAAKNLPMVMQASRALETIENLIEKRDRKTTLRVSGQVHTYRGANYLMPTVLTPAPEAIPTPAPGSDAVPGVRSVSASTPSKDDTHASDDAKPVDNVMQQLLALRQTPGESGVSTGASDTTLAPAQPLIESLSGLDAAVAIVKIDPSVLGISPGDEVPALRREGDFVISRRGRLVHAGAGRARLFVFEADTTASKELPMILQPCLLLQSMEDIVQQRGDTVVFVVSGQIHTYRGANYLLPTMMKLAVDRGNLLN